MLQRIRKTRELIKVCGECEAVWLSDHEMLLETFQQFHRFMAGRGLSDLWLEELEDS